MIPSKDLKELEKGFVGVWDFLGRNGPKIFREIDRLKVNIESTISQCGPNIVRSCEGGGEEDITASLALTVARVRFALRDAELAHTAERVERIEKYARVDGLIQWIKNPGRSTAQNAFTAGTERQVAYVVEDELQKRDSRIVAARLNIEKMDCDCAGEGVGDLGGCFRCLALEALKEKA